MERIVSMSEAVVAAQGTMLGHPRGLWLLFFVEMWERFSFYGMRALLIFYLTQHFLFGDAAASAIYASYGSLVYLMPLLGGLIADRYLGFRKAVVFGAVLLCIGHFGMAIEGEAARVTATASRAIRCRCRSSMRRSRSSSSASAFSSRAFRASSASCTAKDDPRRDGGFTFFYMGINLGAMLASLIVGYLGQTFGWAYGFGLAGVGMLAGLITFVRGNICSAMPGCPRMRIG